MENKTIRVFAPASTANLGCGFDVMGMALDGVGDVLRMSVRPGDSLSIENESGVDLPSDVEKNVITPAVRAFLAAVGKKGGGGDRRGEKRSSRAAVSVRALLRRRPPSLVSTNFSADPLP